MRYKIYVVMGLLTVAATTNAADSISVFDMPLECPFTVIECPYTHISKTAGYYNPPRSGICYESMNDSKKGAHAAIGNDTVKIVWTSSPKIVSGAFGLAKIIDGNLEGVSFNTLGIVAQDRDLQLLSDKFGKPTQVNKLSMQNGYGAQFQSLSANWDLGDVLISYESAKNAIDSGLVIVDTLKGAADRKATLDRLSRNRPSL